MARARGRTDVCAVLRTSVLMRAVIVNILREAVGEDFHIDPLHVIHAGAPLWRRAALYTDG